MKDAHDPGRTLPHQFRRVALFLSAVNFLAGNMGSFSPSFNDFMALGTLSSFIFTFFPLRFRQTATKQNISTVFLLGMAALLFSQGSVFKVLATALLIIALNQQTQQLNRKNPELFCLLLTTIFYSTFLILYQYVTGVSQIFEWLSGLISRTAHLLAPQGIDYGVTYAGLKITVMVLIFCLVVLILNAKKKIRWCASITISIFLINILYVLLHSYGMARLAALNPSLYAVFINYQFVLFFLLLPCGYICLRAARLETFSCNLQANKPSSIALATFLPLLFLLGFYSVVFPKGRDGTVVFHNEGQVDWKLPNFDQFGGRQGGMFGLLIKMLRARGHSVEIKGISSRSLENASTLVLINANRMFSGTEKQLIWQFVKSGGSLLVIGEHTGLDYIRRPFNDLLAPFNIGFNFDSAVSMVPKWAYGFELAPHSITRHIRDENDLQIWIGASLTVRHPARKVIAGQYAFSDQGDRRAKNRGYLGDMQYSPGERLGDLILVAENYYGRGKVLVFGDTSPFQNSALFLSSPFVGQIFQWLDTQGKNFYPFNRLLTALASLSVIAGLGFRKRPARLMATILTALLALSLAIGAIINLIQSDDHYEMKAEIAYIDASHLERFNLDAWGAPNGFGGLCYNLIRNGYYPLVLREFDQRKIMAARLLVLIAPAKAFTIDQIESIKEFIRTGGNLILTLGLEEKNPCRSLLNQFNLDVENIPLGRVQPSQNPQGLSFYNAWSLTYGESDTTVLCRIWNYPTAVLKRQAKGAILLIGDSSFLLNENLEGLFNYSIPNIMFLKRILNQNFRPMGDKP